MAHILIVEDDTLLNQGLTFALKKEGHQINSVHSYKEGISALKDQGQPSIELLLLDINLPDGSGIELCKQARSRSNVPIIFLTANDTEQDMIEGFQNGCDDYIAKPFSLAVLKQRVQAVLRRTKQESKHQLNSGDVLIDFVQMSVMKRGEPVKLTVTEYKLIELLAKHKGQVLTRDSIVEQLWDVDGNFVEANALSVNVRRLRQKIEDDPKQPVYIKTVFGIGYTWGGVD